MSEKEHDCDVNKIFNCDGEFHHWFCVICGTDMGVDNCDGDC